MVVASSARSNSGSSQKPLTNGVVVLGNGHLGLAQPDSRCQWNTRGGSVCGHCKGGQCRELTVDDSNSLLWIDRVYSDSGERCTKARDDEGG